MKSLRLFLIGLALGSFVACENTNDNPVKQRGENVVPNISFSSSVFTTDLDASYIEFVVSLNDDEKVDKASIEMLYNGDNSVIMQEINSFPANIKIDAIDVIDKMGLIKDSISTSDVFSMYVLTTKNGKTTRSIASTNVKIVCAFDADLTQGGYVAVSEDWEAEGNVVLRADEANPYKIYVEGLNDLDGVSGLDEVFFEIDPTTYSITNNNNEFVMSADLGEDWGDDYAGYTNYSYQLVSGSYNSCDGSYTIIFDIYCDLGGWGKYEFVFTPEE